MSTLSDTEGGYTLLVPDGTYDLACQADTYTDVDTSYTAIEVMAGDTLSGYDFTLAR